MIGGQAAAVRPSGEVVYAHAYGEDAAGRPLTIDSLLPVYCQMKPLIGFTAAELHVGGLVDLDSPLCGCVSGISGFDEVTLRTLLDHRAALRPADLVHVMVQRPADRDHFVRTLRPVTEWVEQGMVAYSDVGAFVLVDMMFEALAGAATSSLLAAQLARMGVSDAVRPYIEEAERGELSERIAVDWIVGGEGQCLPNLWSFARAWTADNVPAVQTRANATGMATMLARLGAAAFDVGAPEPYRSLARSSAGWDAVERRSMRYGLGTCASLDAFRLGVPDESIGHVAWGSAGVSWYEPARDLGCSVQTCVVDLRDNGSGVRRLSAAVADLLATVDA